MPFIRPGIPQPAPTPVPTPAPAAGVPGTGGLAGTAASAALGGTAEPCSGGVFGMVGSLMGLGPQTMRVKAGDSLTKIGKAQLPPGSSAAKLATWIELAQKLNKLGPEAILKPGQALLLPSLFLLETAGMGKASPQLSFADGLDAEKIMVAQEQQAESLSSQLKAFDVGSRLKHYQASPPPKPEPADLQWLQKLNAAKLNPVLKHKPAPSELALQSALEKATAWQQMLNEPIRLTRADIKQLSPDVQKQFQSLMAADGKADDLSALDLAKAPPATVKQLLQALKQGGYQPNEQRLVQVLADLSDSFAVNEFSRSSYSFVDDKAPHLSKRMTFHDLPQAEAEAYQTNLKEIRQLLSNPELIQRGGWHLDAGGKRLISLDVSQSKLKDFDLAASARHSDRAKARLQETYQFSPENPYDLKAVKAMAAKLKTPAAQADFIQQYLTAHYVHPGDNTGWSLSAHLSERVGLSESVFFGNPPGLDRLPDGRCVMDCEGFAKISQILLDAVAPGNQSLPIRVPGHIFTAAQLGDSFYVFDVGQSIGVKLSPEETRQFKDLYENYDSRLNNLDPFQRSPRMSRDDFPALYAYTDPGKNNPDPKISSGYKGNYMSTRTRNNVLVDRIK